MSTRGGGNWTSVCLHLIFALPSLSSFDAQLSFLVPSPSINISILEPCLGGSSGDAQANGSGVKQDEALDEVISLSNSFWGALK